MLKSVPDVAHFLLQIILIPHHTIPYLTMRYFINILGKLLYIRLIGMDHLPVPIVYSIHKIMHMIFSRFTRFMVDTTAYTISRGRYCHSFATGSTLSVIRLTVVSEISRP